jgi:rod shape-determining protein MreC
MVLVAVLLLLVVAFFITFFATGGGSALENVAGSAAQPAVAGASGFGVSVRDFFERLFALRDVDKKYAQMETQLQMLTTENQFMQDIQSENERLNNMLGFKSQYPQLKCVPARVIGKEPGSWFMDFTLNMGSDQGVHEDYAVVNELGLVGRVYEVGHNWCKVKAIIDRQSAVPAFVQRSMDSCMVHGSSDPQQAKIACDIYWLPLTSDVVPGDKVVTSDLAGVYPKGLMIGTVVEVDQDKTPDSFAKLSPAVDFAHIENVLIITNNTGVPTDQQIADEEKGMASAKPSTQPSASPGAQPSTQASTQPSTQPSIQPSATTGGGN